MTSVVWGCSEPQRCVCVVSASPCLLYTHGWALWESFLVVRQEVCVTFPHQEVSDLVESAGVPSVFSSLAKGARGFISSAFLQALPKKRPQGERVR